MGRTEPTNPIAQLDEKQQDLTGPKLVLVMAALALAYWVMGQVGLSLAVPPGYATAVWPPSGIALAAVLAFGPRVWPGVFLGSLCINIGLGPPIESFHGFIDNLPVPSLIAAGAALQALAGAWLARHMAGFPNALSRERDVFAFMIWGGAVGCLVAALIGPTVLRIYGIVAPEDYLVNLATWWFGDTVGVLLFAPMVLAWVMRPAKLWRERRFAVTLPMGATMFVAYLIVANGASWERAELALKFNREALVIGSTLETQLKSHERVLESIERFYAASDFVSREEFYQFTLNTFASFGGVHALSWNPVVTKGQRQAFEQATRAEGFDDFHITERGPDGLARAVERGQYVVVHYIEPFRANQKAFGFDVASNPVRLEALNLARDTGRVVATGRITLVQEQAEQFGVLFFWPIYENKVYVGDVEQRRLALTGYAVGVFRTGDIVKAALETVENAGLVFELTDQSAEPGKQLLYTSDTESEGLDVLADKGLFGGHVDVAWERSLRVGQRDWRFEIRPTASYIAANRGQSTWLTLLVTLVVSSIVGAFILIASGRSQVLLGLVEEKTEALRKSSSSLENAQRIAQLGSWEIRQKGGESRTTWSAQTFRIIGLMPEKTEPGPVAFMKVVHPKDKARVRSAFANAIQDGRHLSIEHRVICADGEERTVKQEAEITRYGPGDYSMAGTIHDITAFKEMERVKDEFISSVSHELRTPLTSVQGSLSLIKGEAFGALKPEAAKVVDIALRNTERLGRLINELLDIEKIIAGKMTFALTEHRADDLVDLAVAAMQSYSKNYDVELIWQRPAASSPEDFMFRVDADRFHQIMANLLSNACKFSKPGQSVTVTLEDTGSNVRISVADHGPGIPVEFQQRVFGRFNQADQSDTKTHGGTGLGLAICKSLVEAMGGVIDFETLPNQGTTFWFRFPKI